MTTFNKKSPDKKRSINTTSVVIDSSSEAVVELENYNVSISEETNENKPQAQHNPNLQGIEQPMKKVTENDKREILNSSVSMEQAKPVEEMKNISNNNSEMRKKLIDLDDEKQINYNQKFFDYKNMPQKRISEERDLGTTNNISHQAHKRSKKHDWIKKDKPVDSKEPNKGILNLAPLKAEDKQPDDMKVEKCEKIEILSSDSENMEEDINSLNGSLLNKRINEKSINNAGLVLLSQNQNSNKKSENLSLDLESQINSKDKFEIKPMMPSDSSKPGSKYSDFMKLKKEKNLSINQISTGRNVATELPTKILEKSNYELNLHTLESTFNEFYDIGPKVKKNIFIPEGIKNRAYKSVGGNTNPNNLSLQTSNILGNNKGVVRNKKEREKMNGYKCEICENVIF